MKTQIEKKIDVTIELENKERELVFEVSNLLSMIDDILTTNDLLENDDIFTIKGDAFTQKRVEEFDELRAKFDDFFWE